MKKHFRFKDKIPSVRFEGFSEERRSQRSKKEILISNRLLCLVVILLVLSTILIIRLASIQLLDGEMYAVKLEKYGTVSYTQDASRGEISDRNYTKLVKNSNVINAVYYPPKKIAKEEIETSVNFLMAHINIDTSGITEREKKDYFLLAFEDIAKTLVTDAEKEELKKADNYNKALYAKQISKVTPEMIAQYLDEDTLKRTRLKSTMEQTTKGSTVLLEGLTVNEASIIGENSNMLKGIQVTTDWQREKINGDNLGGVIGRLTTKKQGLPLELKTELVAAGYQNDARVGTSGLEKQYETLLRGIDSTYSVNYDANGNPIINNLSSGKGGTNLRLAIDLELQQYADQLITDTLKAKIGSKYFDRMFFILIDPNNGDILVMSGKVIDKATGEVTDYADGNYKSAYLIGSTTKGGTFYAADKQGAFIPGEIMVDEPIKIKGTPIKASHRNLGRIDDITALAMSSNVYMFKLAMRMGGATYEYNQPINMDLKMYDVYRQSLGELGLGVITGLDVPEESLGYRGSHASRTPGNFLDFVIGQYDSFTPIQMAQFVSTLANGGKRIQPRLVIDGYEEDTELNRYTTFENETTILDDVSDREMIFGRIHEGFRACVTRGLCKSPWAGKPYTVSAKTGSAQVFEAGTNIDYANLLEIGWASSDNPQIAYVAVCPRENTGSSAGRVAGLILDRYHQKYGIK